MIIASTILLGGGCGRKQPDAAVPSAYRIAPQNAAVLSSKRICFGHQSVGYNIIDGIAGITGGSLVVRETRDAARPVVPSLVHFRVGTNMNGESKCDDFGRLMENGMGCWADIAFFKLCYVDVTKETDVERLFAHYCRTMDMLAAKFPQVTFLHCTVPLTTSEPTAGIKAYLKRLASRSFWNEDDNLQRNAFNRKLLERYGERVFDLARCEATLPGGSEYRCISGRGSYFSLAPIYTGDGGHLNAAARRAIAGKLLEFLRRQVP